MTTLHYTAATAKGQSFPVVVVIDGMETPRVTVGGHRGWLKMVNAIPVVALSAAAALALVGATMPDGKGVLKLDRPYTHALDKAQSAEHAACAKAAHATWLASNPELAKSYDVMAMIECVQNHE